VEWSHDVTKLTIVGYLVDKTKPTSDVSCRGRHWASKYFGTGSMRSSEMRKPAKSTSHLANWNLSGFKTTPAVPRVDSRSMVHHQCSARSVS
jgi:hypothetical protein